MEMQRKFTAKHANGVKQYHYEAEPNEGIRKTMEDTCFVHDGFLDSCANSILFGVFDGHGGSRVSDYMSKQFPAYFLKEYKNAKKNAKKAFQSTYQYLDKKLEAEIKEAHEQGSTGTVGLILLEEKDRVLYISHVGDSCAYLFDDKNGEKITPEHRGSNPLEVERVKKAGGSIMMGRLAGVLAVTRAFGDFNLKKFGLTSMPDIRRIELKLSHKFLIVASDGLWDFITEKDVLTIIKEQLEVQDISKTLIKKAIKNGSSDNITVICLKL